MYSPDKCLCVAILFSMPLFNKASPLLAKISMNINAYSNGWQQDITCWTCAKKTDNDVCNNWAPEVLCPIRHSICKTVHRFDEVTLKTVSLTKSCSLPEQCSQSDVVCRVLMKQRASVYRAVQNRTVMKIFLMIKSLPSVFRGRY